MYFKKAWPWFAIGGVLGYGIVHPFVMVSALAMSAAGPGRDIAFSNTIMPVIHSAFSFNMLPWSLGFALLCSIVGLLVALVRQIRTQKIKLQAVMELAGATCHELNQPMQVILGYADMLSKDILKPDDFGPIHQEMVVQIKRMDTILKKIKNITSYKTCPYVEGIKIIDIEKSSQENVTCSTK